MKYRTERKVGVTLDQRRLIFVLVALAASISFGCTNPATEIKIVLDQYDQINQDYFASMKQLHKDGRPDTFSQDLALLRDRCSKVRRLSLEKTPADFQAAFNKVAYSGCENKSIADMTTYEGDPRTKLFREAEKDLELVCSRYGYDYKHSSKPK